MATVCMDSVAYLCIFDTRDANQSLILLRGAAIPELSTAEAIGILQHRLL